MTTEIETYTGDMLTELYRTIHLIRTFEEAGIDLYREGSIRGYFHPSIGQEAVAVGTCAALDIGDAVVSTHRGHGHAIARGADIDRMMAELCGRKTGCAHGRSGSMHMADMSRGIVGGNGIVGGGIPLALGVAAGMRMDGEGRVVAVFFGDGAANTGAFAESLNLAAVYALPVLFIFENNCYAAVTPAKKTARCDRFSDRGAGYGVPANNVFGNDAVLVLDTVAEAVKRAREGVGPTLIEAETFRMSGHHVNDPGAYMPEDTLDDWRKLDPLALIRERCLEAGVTKARLREIDTEVQKKVDAAVTFALNSPEPTVDGFFEEIDEYDI